MNRHTTLANEAYEELKTTAKRRSEHLKDTGWYDPSVLEDILRREEKRNRTFWDRIKNLFHSNGDDNGRST